MTMFERINLTGRTSAEVRELVAPWVDRAFRGDQVARWIVTRNAASFDDMTNLPKSLRASLEERFSISEPPAIRSTVSGDGSRKYLVRLSDGAMVECVAMRDAGKATLCVSSQAGCALGCKFCVTGALGAGRNLLPWEIVGQYRLMLRDLDDGVDRVNLVFMGMGEPLLNPGNLGPALAVLFETVSPKRVTVSTAGIVPGIRWLASLDRRPKLAISLNAPDQERREQLMPIARRYRLDELMTAVRAFPLERGRRVTFEYVLIRDFNDAIADARALAALLHGVPAKLNVIPLNEDREHLPGLRRPAAAAVENFAAALREAGLTVTVRWSRGADVAAACGQLRGRTAANPGGAGDQGLR